MVHGQGKKSLLSKSIAFLQFSRDCLQARKLFLDIDIRSFRDLIMAAVVKDL